MNSTKNDRNIFCEIKRVNFNGQSNIKVMNNSHSVTGTSKIKINGSRINQP